LGKNYVNELKSKNSQKDLKLNPAGRKLSPEGFIKRPLETKKTTTKKPNPPTPYPWTAPAITDLRGKKLKF
jgi:hypothetical protein